jgi:hypothetical protein
MRGTRTLRLDAIRAAQLLRLIEAVRGDLSYSMRQLRKYPLFTAAAHHRGWHRSERHDGDSHQQRVPTLAGG